MKKTLLIMLSLVLAFALIGCGKGFKPAPIGDELVWTSHKNRPAWTVEAPDVNGKGAYVFVGQSLYHSTERAARTNAEANAASQAALYLNRDVNSSYREQTHGGTTEAGIQDAGVVIDGNVEITTQQILSKLSPEDWYLEMWKKGGQTFWRAFVMVNLPKGRI